MESAKKQMEEMMAENEKADRLPAKVTPEQRKQKNETATEILQRVEKKLEQKLSLGAYCVSSTLLVSAGTYYQVGQYGMAALFIFLGIVASVFQAIAAALKRNNIDIGKLLKGKKINEIITDFTENVYKK